MASTDSPLKQLIETCITDFAAWLLNTAIKDAQPLNVELLAQTVRVDQLYRVTLASGRVVKLHIEFQGIRSHEPMRLRELDYMTRLVKLDPDLDLHSVVLYVGKGAGAGDTGEHQINGADGQAILRWRYQVIHLWKMTAQELLVLNRPALLPLVGQTQIDNPDEIVLKVVEQLSAVVNTGLRHQLFAGLLALVSDEEIIGMIEKLLEDDELLTDTPYLRRIREKGRQEALIEGLSEGRAEGIVEGIRIAQRRNILNIMVWRFDPPSSIYQQVENLLSVISDEKTLDLLLKSAMQSQDFAEFQAALRNPLSINK